ncbi:hypothetical protein QEN19_004008 [Hanseniaspora menglaensis]
MNNQTAAGNNISSLYPEPPSYYKAFTEENLNLFNNTYADENLHFLSAFKSIREKEINLKNDNVSYKATNDISTNFYKQTREIVKNEDPDSNKFLFLAPPNLPEDDGLEQFSMFGNLWNIKEELPELGPIQLFPKQNTENFESDLLDKKKELKKLTKSLLLNFLLLITNLSVDTDLKLEPDSKENHLEHIRIILVNMHHLLNQYRPHQVNENFIMLLEEQINHKKLEIETIIQIIAEVKKDLSDLV